MTLKPHLVTIRNQNTDEPPLLCHLGIFVALHSNCARPSGGLDWLIVAVRSAHDGVMWANSPPPAPYGSPATCNGFTRQNHVYSSFPLFCRHRYFAINETEKNINATNWDTAEFPLLIIQLSKRGIIIPSESGLPCGQQYNLGVSKLATPLNHLLTDCKKPRRCSISICWKTYHRITAAAPTYQALLWDIPKVLEVCLKNALKPMLWGADKKRAKFWIFQNIEEEKNYILW